MRIRTALISICSTLLLAAAPAETDLTAEQLLQRGLDSYRAARYTEAAQDLNASAKAFLSPQRMQSYVSSGTFENLDRLEVALVYLALAQSRLGKEAEAREAVLRLMTAERIEPTYAKLPLTADAADFETLAARLVSDSALPRNVQLAGGRPPASAVPPAAVVAEATPPRPVPVPAPIPEPPPTPAPVPAPVSVAEAPLVTPSQPVPTPVPVAPPTEQRVAEQRAAIQKEADERVAAERAAVARAAEERLAAERLQAQRDAEARVAEERARMQREAEARIAEERARVQREAESRVVSSQREDRRNFLATLRQADALADTDQIDQANRIYESLANAADTPRDIIIEAAVGLYRTSAYRSAITAFRRLGTFARGEEDLRYYNAVALYETGSIDEAKKELSCALPYLQINEEVTRYRVRIEQTPSRQALR